ncbi:potassium transporter TrkA [Arenicella chitinivorans]|uniref:Potassium transporter TrkA n=1 Tax=Arenicella chitinivorans TaxID=1329800 RepID=A0A918RS47_9GAMM|nr:SLC13 family permease [Arenicella chitinivorans]GHA07633.1 potassium transporter TrkA [Arenicella chitinivorans]
MQLDPHAMWALGLTVFALILFTRERIPLETSSLMVVVILAISFQVFPYQNSAGQTLRPVMFFAGFAHEALVAVCGLMVAGYALVRTGALDPIGRGLAKLWSFSPMLSVLITLLVSALLSAVVNNTPIVVLLLPIMLNVAIRTKNSPSGILMPMGLATLLGGMTTTIGTSTNLLVVSVASDMGLEEIGMFDFFMPAALAGLIGIVYLWLIAPKLLPNRTPNLENSGPRIFTAHLHVKSGSFADGKTLTEIIEKTEGAIQVSGIRRSENTFTVPLPDAKIRAGDRLLVRDTPTQLKEYERVLGATLYSKGHEVSDDNPLSEDSQHLAELVIDRGSPMIHRTLNEVHFSDVYQLVTLAIHRKGKVLENMPQGIAKTPLRLGDILLVQGSNESIEEVKNRGHFLVLDATTELPSTKYAGRAVIIMGLTILAAALGLVPIAISAVAGALAMVLTNCLKWQDIQRALSAQVILIVVASLALGTALTQTGATVWVAHEFVSITAGMSDRVIFSGLMLLMAILTNIVSNNAAAVIGTPIAISIATQLGLPPEAFVLAVLFGANMSFATPMAYQTNLLVMNAGGYTFMDFVKAGVPLTIIMLVAISLIVPMMYGF